MTPLLEATGRHSCHLFVPGNPEPSLGGCGEGFRECGRWRDEGLMEGERLSKQRE